MALEIFGSPQRVAIPVGYIVEKPISIAIAPPIVEVAPPVVEVEVEEFPWEKYIPWALVTLVIIGI